ncbi:hypothetical protein UPYG_G00080230 [Umbra pygmaea]|uniref:Kinesin-like protein KIFC3 n=1 Tax=Umbra pygmaea TaxID=75934 RepID=A0ABD0Y2Y1_UMBPY
MYVLCTIVVLTIHSLLKYRHKTLEARDEEAEDRAALPLVKDILQAGRGARSPQPRGPGHCSGSMDRETENNMALSQETREQACETDIKAAACGCSSRCKADQELGNRARCSLGNVTDGRKQLQLVQRPIALLSPAVMFGTRKTWDLGHAPCRQELWKKDVSLDGLHLSEASSVDFLMSDSEEDGSFLSLPATAFFPQRTAPAAANQLETSQYNQQLHIQEKVCEFQVRLQSQEAFRRLQRQRPQQGNEQSLQEKTDLSHGLQEELHPTLPNGLREVQRLAEPQQQPIELLSQEGEQLIVALRTQAELEEKLLDQTQEVERLRSELGATDLEKHLELLVVENKRLKQELKECKASLPQQPPPTACTASVPPPSQDVEALRAEVSLWESRARQRESRLADLEQQIVKKGGQAEILTRQLEESKRHAGDMQRQLDESKHQRGEAEQQLSARLRDCEEELARQAARPPQIKYVTERVEVESPGSQQALSEAHAKSAALQEQMSLQRQLLRELEAQLHDSQRNNTQLRAQILVYEGEMERAQGQLEAEMQNLEDEKNRVIEEAFIRAESEMKAVHENLAGVRMNLLTLQPALRTLTCDYNCLKRQVQDFPFMLEKAITEAKQEICQVIGEVSSANQELLRKYKREMNLRKKCHNELVRLKGNIRVFCRVRPLCRGEQDSAENMVSFDPEDDALLYLSNKGKLMTFELDKVFHPQATQEEVFQEVQSLVTSCIDGFNVCIFAYGQTGSGKTYTMEGVLKDPGINQRALRLLFSEVTEKAPDWDYKITVSMVEIYNETIRNLLGDNQGEKLDIKMNPDGSGQLYVPGLTEFTVISPEDINQVFELGHMNRATACTNLNEHSSRSHALLIITVAGFNSSTGHRTQGKLNLVDLAGSERIAKSGAEGSRLREAQCINKSLSALGDVINALRSRHSHVPFRNSRLTYLLSDSLSGDSKTLMMVQISPLVSNMSESVCSLKFAQRVRTIELGNATRRQWEISSTSSSPTHDSVELDSPPVTPVPLPISRASSAGSTLSSSSKTPGARRRSQSQLSTGRLKLAV